MKKGIIILSVLSLFFLVSCSNTSNIEVDVDNYDAIQARGTIIVGLECAYAPFNWTVEAANASSIASLIDGTSNYCDGYDIQIAQAIADGLGVDLILKAVEWDGLIPSLAESAQIDLIIAGMSPTAERALTVSFSDEYYNSTHVVLIRSDSEYASATSIADFIGADVVGQMSTIYDDLIDQMSGANHVNPLGDVPTIVTGINSGTYDATVLELPVAIAICQSNPDLSYIQFTSGNGFEVSYEDSAVSIATRQGDVTLLARINEILATISSDQREAWMVEAIDRQP
ncbi:MAG: transporter substrate-binding domain-containing protein [Candidatus Izemoplasmatales bacterium]|jgi:ABC-type amino acid transport substrate-binding protein|nr:transporter substrate-binding domain-containing protein [Candidatus Izemoplasmatales bacterium]